MTNQKEIAPALLEMLVCPLTKGTLEYNKESQELISREAKLAFPVRDGIPIMLVDEARSLQP
jgi:uncharacterized protein YbaR (Trm112 family)